MKEKRTASVYAAVILCGIAALIDSIIGILSLWPSYIYYIIWIQMAIIVVTAIVERIPIRLHAVIFATFTASTVFFTGLCIGDYYIEVLLLCGTLVLVSFYHFPSVLLYQLILSIIAVILHIGVFDIIEFHRENDRMEFFMSMFLMVGIGITLFVSILRDELVRTQLRQVAERAESAEHSKSDFLANMSHEIRTPMNAIIGMCELALREKNIAKSTEEYCRQIQSSGRSLLAIVNDVLDFSKIESGKMEIVQEEFNLSSVVNDVVNMTINRMGDKDLELMVKLDAEIPRGLLGDEVRIRQIMINLLTNAVKYTPKGIIVLTIGKTVRPYGINLDVRVKDSGIGIKKENLEKIFYDFQQVDTKKNRSVEGTGLGLVITKRLLRSMGGFINVRSEYGEGSEFRFVIPLRVSNQQSLIDVKDSENINVACFLDVKRFQDLRQQEAYTELLASIGGSLQLKHVICQKIEDLKMRMERGNITHCFVGKQEYVENQEYFKQWADKIEIIIVQNRRDSLVVPENMRCIYKPVYELPIADIFNNEREHIVDIRQNSHETISFSSSESKVLIVDDNVVNLQVAAGLMKPYGMEIFTAHSGREAIDLVKTQDYDLIFMDHMMPEMDGVEATQIIRDMADEYYKKVPIIALTANAIGGAREMFLKNGFDGFLAKPIELSALDRILKQHLPKGKVAEKKVEEEEIEKEEVKNVGGFIDIPTGLMYVGDSMDAYLSILEVYIEDGKKKLAFMQEQFEKEDWANYIIEAHAMKSTSLSIGAKGLSEQAKGLELNGKEKNYDYILEHHEEVAELFQKVLAEGEAILAANKPEEPMEERPLRIVLVKIKRACSMNHAEEIVQVAKEAVGHTYKGVSMTEQFKKIMDYADSANFDAILEVAEKIIRDFALEGI